MNKRWNILFCFLVLILPACSDGLVKLKTVSSKSETDSGKYEYLLSEALRQKYLGSMSNSVELLEECTKIAPDRAVAYYELSQILAFNGDQKKAVEFAVKAAEREKGNPWLQVYCGGTLANNNMLDSSIMYLERALVLSPEDLDVKTALGKVYLEAGDLKKAEVLLSDIKNKGVLEENEIVNIISSLMAAEYFDEAEKWSLDLLKINSEEAKYKAFLADIYRIKGEEEKADSIYSAIITQNPGEGESQMLVMSYLLEKKDYKNALTFLSGIMMNDKISREGKIAFVRYILTDSVFVNDWNSTIDINLRVLEAQFIGDEEVMIIRPDMYNFLGRKEEAIERYYEIILSCENAFYSEQQLIILLAEEKRYQELFDVTKPFATKYNTSLLGKVYYALSAMELSKFNIAEEELKKAFILAGNNDEMKFNVLSVQADLSYRQKRFSESFQFLEEALKIKPDDAGTLNNYAYYLAENNSSLAKAYDMALKVIKAEPDNATFLDTYGWVLFKMGKNKQAYKAVNRSLSISKDRDAELLEHLGFILQKMNKCDEAVIYFEEAINRDIKKEYLKKEIEKCSSK